MELKRFVAADSKSAMEQVRANYGEDALIISTTKVGNKTEMICAIDLAGEGRSLDEDASTMANRLNRKATEVAPDSASKTPTADNQAKGNFTQELGRAIGDGDNQTRDVVPPPVTAPSKNEMQEIMQTIQGELADLRASLERQANAQTPLQRAQAAVTAFNEQVSQRTAEGYEPMSTQIHRLQQASLSEQGDWQGKHLILGRPGAGKTTVVAELISVLTAASKEDKLVIVHLSSPAPLASAARKKALLTANNVSVASLCQRLNIPFFSASDEAMLGRILSLYGDDHQIIIDSSAAWLEDDERLMSLITEHHVLPHLCFAADCSLMVLETMRQSMPWLLSNIILTRMDLMPDFDSLCSALDVVGGKLSALTGTSPAQLEAGDEVLEKTHPAEE